MPKNPSQPKPYRKADSLVALSGAGAVDDALLARVRALYERLNALDTDAHRRAILDRACRALLGQATATEPAFAFRPHIVTEIERIVDAEFPRYLFYRYRYDVFPGTRELDDYPPCVQIEPTSTCNYRCVFCYQTDRGFTQGRHGHMGQMPVETFRRIVDEIEGHVEAVTLASRGEPLLCKNIGAMLGYVAGKFLALKINTNAWYLDERMAHAILSAEPNTVVFSADAADAELYARLRVNGRLDRVVANIRRLAEIRARDYPQSRVITRVSGVRYSNDQNFSSIESFWREHVDQIAFVDYNPWENTYEAPANGMDQPCSDLWRRAFVWWDGRINPCDVDYKSELAAGRMEEGSLRAVWTGEAYRRLRATHLAGQRQNLSPCKGCTLV